LSQWFVVVALPGVGRPKARVPKKMPIVTPSTASCAPKGPFAAIRATGIGATRYHGFNFILGSPTGMGSGRVTAQWGKTRIKIKGVKVS
jgi:hypothetical protein